MQPKTLVPSHHLCPTCEGTGHMSAERAQELNELYREPIPRQWGCETCQGWGQVEDEE